MWKHLKKLDWVLILAAFGLSVMGFISLYSSSPLSNFSNLYKQLIFFALGFIIMILISFFDWKIFRTNSYIILILYLVCLLLLLGLLVFAPATRGVKGWYKLGGISLDPIEGLKIVLIILFSKYFSMRHIEMYKIKHILVSACYFGIPAFLIFLQPDMGSVLVLGILWIGMLLISGIKSRHFLILLLCGILLSAFSWGFLLQEYQKDRIINFVKPQLEPLGAGWNRNQSLIAVGSGGLLGKGIGNGSQAKYGFLPEPQTDFIFAAIAEETGFVGIVILFSLFFILIWRIIKIALISKTNFPRLFASGFVILLLAEIFIHVGMNLGILPIIGISLPLVSYGGSNLIFTFIGLGILQSIKISNA